MMNRTAKQLAKVLALLIAMLMLVAYCGGCSYKSDQGSSNNTLLSTDSSQLGDVGIFVPSDSVFLQTHTMIHRWSNVSTSLKTAFENQGFSSQHITSYASSSLEDQSRKIQDFVVAMATQGYVVDSTQSDNTTDQSGSDNNVDGSGSKTSSDSTSSSGSTGNTEASNNASNSLSSSNADDTTNTAPTSPTTLIIAPVIEPQYAMEAYGDFLTLDLEDAKATSLNDNVANDNNSDENTSATPDASADDANADANTSNDIETSELSKLSETTESSDSAESIESAETSAHSTSQTSQDAQDLANLQRFTSALELAQQYGMKVIMLANNIDGFTPDAFVEMLTAYNIGYIQAQRIASKLDLDNMDAVAPAIIEIMLPYNPSQDSAQITQQLFKGALDALQPYIDQGRVNDTRGILSTTTSENDWQLFTIYTTDDSLTSSALHNRLINDEGDLQPIDAIIAFHDLFSLTVVQALETVGYEGTSADINPSITLSGILGNITGKPDLQRQAVPAPNVSTNDANGGEMDASEHDSQPSWPLIASFGIETSVLPSLVDGKVWMSSMIARNSYAEDIALYCETLHTKESLDNLDFLHVTTIHGNPVTTIAEPLVAVSANNMKSALIDTGYISLAEAGL